MPDKSIRKFKHAGWVYGLLCTILILFGCGKAADTTVSFSDKPEHAVLFIIDGLHYEAPDRLNLNSFNALKAIGTSYKETYLIQPAHPHTGTWAEYYTSSIPNPSMLGGTLLLEKKQTYISDCFYPEKLTAHVANALAYASLNTGYHLTSMMNSPEDDAVAVEWAVRFFETAGPAFMRVHLQATGGAGSTCFRTEEDVPWKQNIWAEGSPYIEKARRADELLGQFVQQLKKLHLFEKTLLIVTADHGQATEGWHTPGRQESWKVPLVMVGPGIQQGVVVAYAEHIDIVPTICHMMDVAPPTNCHGRVLAEALINPPDNFQPIVMSTKELNELLLDIDSSIEQILKRLQEKPDKNIQAAFNKLQNDYAGLDDILEWKEFGTVSNLISHNRKIAEGLSLVMQKLQM